MATVDLTAQQLRELFHYNAETGVFTRLVQTSNRVKVGDVAGCKSGGGYVTISVFGRQCSAHRLAWLYVHGTWPVADIDHINGNPSDNRAANLRDVSRRVNKQNQRRAHITSTSGMLGAAADRGRWQARIRVDGKQRYLGNFDTPDLAHAAYLDAKRLLHEGNTL